MVTAHLVADALEGGVELCFLSADSERRGPHLREGGLSPMGTALRRRAAPVTRRWRRYSSGVTRTETPSEETTVQFQPGQGLRHPGRDVWPIASASCGGNRPLTYAQVAERSNRLASYLHGQGLGPRREREGLAGHESGQDHVALALYNGNEYLEGMLGSYRARVAPFNVNYRYVGEELRYLLNDAHDAGHHLPRLAGPDPGPSPAHPELAPRGAAPCRRRIG